jgi:1-acyl-sn-glycerol-3-phosphate acyltransferase
MIRGLLKSVRTWSLALLYVTYGALGSLRYRDAHKRVRFLLESKRFFSRLGLTSLGIGVAVRGENNVPRDRGVLLVCNHLSYIDILVLSSILPCLFVTAVEWRRAPFVGWMARVGGSVFVRRDRRSGLGSEVETVAKALEEGLIVVLFPEATSSDGSRLLPFKTSLFAAAERARSCVVPACIRYTHVNGEPLGKRTARLVHFHRPMRFFGHALRVPFLRSIRVALDVLPPVERTAWKTRKELSQVCRERIEEAYRLTIAD